MGRWLEDLRRHHDASTAFAQYPIYEADLVDQFFRLQREALLAHFGKESRAETVVPRVNQKNLAQMLGMSITAATVG